jgi:hypothetical protein
MTPMIVPALFPLGDVVISPGAQEAVPPQHLRDALLRHATGDWGKLDAEDWKLNDESVEDGARLLSRYSAPDGRVFWIITEHDRSLTTIFLPEEY